MADVEESPAQRAARVRREKREKKILEGGQSRLEKITGVSGRSMALAPDATPPRSTQPESPPPPYANSDPRPALAPADVSPGSTPASSMGDSAQHQQFMDQLQQLLSGMGAGGAGGSDGVGGDGTGAAFNPDDPAASLPPGLASLLSGGGAAAAQAQTPPRSAALWKVFHLFASLLLGAYILWAYAFTGAERISPAQGRSTATPLASGDSHIDFSLLKKDRVTVFSLFASVELALQSARYLLQDRSAETAGLWGTAAAILPAPWGYRVRLLARYFSVVATLLGDAVVVVFVLGVGAWWSGA